MAKMLSGSKSTFITRCIKQPPAMRNAVFLYPEIVLTLVFHKVVLQGVVGFFNNQLSLL